MISEREKFKQWYEREQRENGLKAMHFTLADDLPEGTTAEDIFRELNAIERAIAEGKGEPLVFNDSSKFTNDDPRHGCDGCCDFVKCWPNEKAVEQSRKAQEIINKHLYK